MNQHLRPLLAALGLTLIAATASAQYLPPATTTTPASGEIDQWLRSNYPAMSAWDVGLDLRLRLEDKDGAGFDYTGSNADFRTTGNGLNNDNVNRYILTRIMPRVGYTGDEWSFLIQLRSSESIDDQRGDQKVAADALKPGQALPENDANPNLYQAYIVVGDAAKDPLSLKVGRQALSYGDQRLVGAFDWNNDARSFDAAKVHWQNALFGADFFVGGLVYHDDDSSGWDQSHLSEDTFSGAYFIFPSLIPDTTTEAYFLARNVGQSSATVDLVGTTPYDTSAAPFRNPAKQDLYTVGVHLKSKPVATNPWDYDVELMHQFGDIATTGPTATSAAVASAARLTQDANAAYLGGGYTWKQAAWQPRLGLSFSYASGDSSTTDAANGKSETFQNLFATTHLFYGYMDLSSLQNLEDYRLTFSVQPEPNVNVALDLHQQFLASSSDSWYNVAGVARTGGTANVGNGYAVSPKFSRNLGQELDLIVGWQVLPSTKFELGLCHYFEGAYIEESLSTLGSSDANYAYFQVSIKL